MDKESREIVDLSSLPLRGISSSNKGNQIADFAVLPYQRYEQQQIQAACEAVSTSQEREKSSSRDGSPAKKSDNASTSCGDSQRTGVFDFLRPKTGYAEVDIDQYFRAQFKSGVEWQATSQSEQAELEKINYRISISKVPQKWQRAFAITRGQTVFEKVRQLSNENVSTNKAFKERYKTEIIEDDDENSKFYVKTRLKRGGSYHYINCIDTVNGIIIAHKNRRDLDAKAKAEGEPLHNSEILYNQLLFVLEQQCIVPSDFNLTQMIQADIDNEETKNTFKLCAPPPDKVQSANDLTYQFKKGDNEYYAVLGTPNAYSALFLINQHSDTLGNKEITDIKVSYLHDKMYNMPEMVLYISEIMRE